MERSLYDETSLDNLFRSLVGMISYPNLMLNPIRDVRKYTLNSEVTTFPQRALMLVSYQQRLLVTFPGLFLALVYWTCHGIRKRIFIQLQYASQYCFCALPTKIFLMRGTDETFMVETAVCPITHL